MLYRLSDKFGWTPDEIRDMNASDVERYMQIMGLESQLNKANQERG